MKKYNLLVVLFVLAVAADTFAQAAGGGGQVNEMLQKKDPTQVLSFKASVSDDAGKLYWLTEDEKGLQSFTIERSINNRDFDPIAIMPAMNEADGQLVYKYADSAISKLSSPSVYYRLKITDAQGQSRYSSIANVVPVSNKAGISIFPKQVAKDVTVEINAQIAEQANWMVTDFSGKTVLQDGIILTQGKNTMNINLANMRPGIYYLKVAGTNISQTVRMQKV